MTDTLPATGAELLDVHRLHLTEVEAPKPSPEDEAARDRIWDEAVRANPHLFDGPVTGCAALERRGGPQDGDLTVSWARLTFRHRALRRVPGNTDWLPSLFVSVIQPVDDGSLLVGRMASWTASPGRWLLPGGSVEPPAPGAVLDQAVLAREAARELVEEVGVELEPPQPRLWGLTRDGNGSLGVVHLAPPRSAGELRARFEALASAERAEGREPELDRIAFVRSLAELTEVAGELGGRPVDYLTPVLRRHQEESAARND
ncbi:NUDIX domain-containing protein [Streptomyces sp. NPDC058171]